MKTEIECIAEALAEGFETVVLHKARDGSAVLVIGNGEAHMVVNIPNGYGMNELPVALITSMAISSLGVQRKAGWVTHSRGGGIEGVTL